jgi:hypothetical protein
VGTNFLGTEEEEKSTKREVETSQTADLQEVSE